MYFCYYIFQFKMHHIRFLVYSINYFIMINFFLLYQCNFFKWRLKSRCIIIHKYALYNSPSLFYYSFSLFTLLTFYYFVCINLFANSISNTLIFHFLYLFFIPCITQVYTLILLKYLIIYY